MKATSKKSAKVIVLSHAKRSEIARKAARKAWNTSRKAIVAGIRKAARLRAKAARKAA